MNIQLQNEVKLIMQSDRQYNFFDKNTVANEKAETAAITIQKKCSWVFGEKKI